MHIQQAREDLSSIQLKNLHCWSSKQDLCFNNMPEKGPCFRIFFEVQKNLCKEQKNRVVHRGKMVQDSAGILQRPTGSRFRTGVWTTPMSDQYRSFSEIIVPS